MAKKRKYHINPEEVETTIHSLYLDSLKNNEKLEQRIKNFDKKIMHYKIIIDFFVYKLSRKDLFEKYPVGKHEIYSVIRKVLDKRKK